jgi:integrase
VAFDKQTDIGRLALPQGMAEICHFDAKCKGLAVRIQRAGRPAYVVWYTHGGKRKRVTLGSTVGMTLQEAREQANEIHAAARKGRDVGAERKQAREAAKVQSGILTVGDLIREYITQRATPKQRAGTLVETKRALERHLQPLHSRPVTEISRREVAARLLELTRTSGPIAANRARANLSACFMWGVSVGLVDHNPTLGTLKNQEVSRARVLSIPELRAIWQATRDGHAHSAIVRLLILTGQRKSEVGGLVQTEIDRERGLMLLPAERTKNRRAHELPLSRQALEVIAAFPEHPKYPYIFGRHGRAPFSGWSQCKIRLDARIAKQQGAPLQPWTLHDLRRTFSTMALDYGLTEPHIVEAILNHASGHQNGVAGVYNRAAYREPKRTGLQHWADWLGGIVEPE